MRKTFIVLLLIALLATGCSTQYNGPSADLVIVNGAVITSNQAMPHAEAVAVKGDKIIAVGSNRLVRQAITDGKTRVIDAEGNSVVPGFNDAHVHFLSGGNSLLNLDFRYITDINKIAEMVKERVAVSRPGEVIRGRGWDHELFPDKQWPTKEVLDAVAPENPVMLSRADGHSVWVNSVVIKHSGITRTTFDPPGGTIVKDPVTGEPAGIFKETATSLLKLPSEYPLSASSQSERSELALAKALEEARRTGVTSVQHLNGNVDLLKKFRDEGKLTARVTFNMWLTADEKQLAEYDQMRQAYPAENDWIRFGYLKGFIDGTLGSGTALMFEPFEDDQSTSGLAMMEQETLEKRILASDKRKFQVGIHAIGTKANHWILNAYEKAAQVNGKRDSRHRSEHAQILIPEDIPRFGKLGVIASMQPTHCITDKNFAEKRLGLERCKGAYAWQSLLNTGAKIAFGTDWPVEPLDPMEGIYAAVSRKARGGEPGDGWYPEQKLSLEKAIELYTLGAAYAEFMEDRKGMLKEGYLADIVVLDKNLKKIPHEEIMKTGVQHTIVGGEVVYTREGQ